MELRFENVDMPEVSGGSEVLVKIKAAGICGSDVHIYHGTSPVATYPRVMGHEMVGVVDKVGADVTKVRPGDRVIVDQIISCGACYPCSIGRPNVCLGLKVRGVHIDGGYREYITADEDSLYILPEHLSFSDAVMIEPMSIAFQAVSRAKVVASDTVLVLGAGALGKSLIKALLLTDAELIVADVAEQRLEEARALGVRHCVNTSETGLAQALGGKLPTVSIDAAGFPESLALLADITCNAGRVVTMSFLKDLSEIAQFKITSKELDIIGSRLQNGKFKEVLDGINGGLIDVTGQVSHEIPFERAKEAFEMIDRKDPSVKKVVLVY